MGIVLAAIVDDAVKDDATDDEAMAIIVKRDAEVELDMALAFVEEVVQVVMEHKHLLPGLTQTLALIALQLYLQATVSARIERRTKSEYVREHKRVWLALRSGQFVILRLLIEELVIKALWTVPFRPGLSFSILEANSFLILKAKVRRISMLPVLQTMSN